MQVRNGGFFADDDPPETPSLSAMMAILLVVVSVAFAVLVLLARVFLFGHWAMRRSNRQLLTARVTHT
jgi:hypothetical protein